MMTLAIIIPTHNRLDSLVELLNEINYQKHGLEINILVYVVVDEVEDDNYTYINKNFNYINSIKGNGNLWFTNSINLGLKNASENKPDYFLILNDDNIISEDYLKTVQELLPFQNKKTIVGSISISRDDPSKILFCGVKKIKKHTFSYVGYDKSKLEIKDSSYLLDTQVLVGRGTIYPSCILDDIGYWDEKLPQYGSDEEYILRAKKHGYKIYICKKLKLKVNDQTTHITSVKLHPKFGEFLKSLMNKYSPNYFFKNIYIVLRYGNKFYFPLLLPAQFIGLLKSFLKNRRKAEVYFD